MAEFSRVFIEQVNNDKVHVIYDYAYGQYIATEQFFDLLSDIQSSIKKREKKNETKKESTR